MLSQTTDRLKQEGIRLLRTLLTLGRVDTLPTVWSNCLAGWLLSGGGSSGTFLVLWMGATFLYLGGAFCNDACDVQFDTINRRNRPIPSGAIALQTVWLWCLGWFGLGALLVVSLSKTAAVLTVLLLGCIILYDIVHKLVTFSPWLFATCRLLLYLLGGSATESGISGLTIWCGLAIWCYTAGVVTLARYEGAVRLPPRWPILLLAAPLLLAWVVNGPGYRVSAFFCSLALAAWVIWCLRHTYWISHRNVSYTVAGLRAGIVLVDMLAVAGGSPYVWVFLLWFAAALLFQRVLPMILEPGEARA